MAALKWSGFTEDDLRKIREQNGYDSSESDSPPLQSNSRAKQVTFGVSGSKKSVSKKQSSLHSSTHRVATNNNGDLLVDPNEMLSPPKIISKSESCEAKQVKLAKGETGHGRLPSNIEEDATPLSPINGLPVVKLRVKSDGHSVEVLESHKKMHSKTKSKPERKASSRVNVAPLDDSHALHHEKYLNSNEKDDSMEINTKKNKITLEEFQIRQKMIEEQNKRRRAMLSKAISDRKKKTQAETEKLTHIQRELQRLDGLVSNDVAILRDQIEVASMEFNDVQKRYEKAEREFVEAKIDLFKKMDRKEQLTEYLCTIIEENEMRKAKKLAELMYELELESLIEECHEGAPVLPQLCALNDITYSACTTLRDPNLSPTIPTANNEDKSATSTPAVPSETDIAEQPNSCTESADEFPNISNETLGDSESIVASEKSHTSDPENASNIEKTENVELKGEKETDLTEVDNQNS